jgi:hypothetical protein
MMTREQKRVKRAEKHRDGQRLRLFQAACVPLGSTPRVSAGQRANKAGSRLAMASWTNEALIAHKGDLEVNFTSNTGDNYHVRG